MNSGKSSEDVIHFKERLSELEYTVLPTENDKWVSLHSSFGLVCWCDNEKLKKRFKNKDKIEFISFGENDDEGQEVLQTKVSGLMHSLGIPSISEVTNLLLHKNNLKCKPLSYTCKVPLMDIRILMDKSRPFLNCVDALTLKPSAEPSSCSLYTG